MVSIDQEDFQEVLAIERNKQNRNPNRNKYRTRVEQAYDVLIEKAKTRETIYYGELMDRIGTSRGYIGGVLGGVSRLELRKGNPPLSAIAIRKDNDRPGAGFWENLLADHGLWEPGEDRDQVWREQVERVFNHDYD